MPVLHLHKFIATKAASASDFETSLQSARGAIRQSAQHDSTSTQHATIGIVQTPEANALHFWTEATTTEASVAQHDLDLIEKLSAIFGSYVTYIRHRIELSTSAFDESNNPFTSKLIEVVQNIFPTAQATPAFRESIEKDFRRFDDAYMPGVSGTTGLIVGWTLDSQEMPELDGGPATSMFVIRGWESQESFDRSVRSEHAQKAFPIVFGWKAPYKLVSFSSSVINGCSRVLTSFG
jgi:hypothetical protein